MVEYATIAEIGGGLIVGGIAGYALKQCPPTGLIGGSYYDGITDSASIITNKVGNTNILILQCKVDPQDQIAGTYNYHKDIIRSQCVLTGESGGIWGLSTDGNYNTNELAIIEVGWITNDPNNQWWTSSKLSLPKNKTNNVEVVWNRSNGTVEYILNGRLLDQKTFPVGTKPSTTQFNIGADCGGHFKGYIYDWNVING